MTQPAVTVAEVVDLYRRWGTDHYDEELSQLDHALQTAALAAAAGASDELVAASLLHDVGHLLELESGGGVADADLGHEGVGARYLAGLFGPGVTAPIAMHVRAKRYRASVDAGYLAQLSAGSTRSLALQGGPMTEEEAAAFEVNPASAAAVALRGWDDGGKVDGLVVAPFDAYLPVLERLAVAAG